MENNVSLQQADDVSSDQCSCDEEGENPVVNIGSDKVELNLTLDNFDADDVPDDCPFVLTSPRSLEACKIVGVRVCDQEYLLNPDHRIRNRIYFSAR